MLLREWRSGRRLHNVMKSGSDLHTPFISRLAAWGAHLSGEAGGRPGAAGPARVGRPEEAPLLGGPRSAVLLTGPPELSTGGGRESSKPALAEAATGLTLFP